MKNQKLRLGRLALNEGGPAGHQPAPHYLGEEFDAEDFMRHLLNQAKDLNPDRFARAYFQAGWEHREESARHPQPFERERELEELFGELIARLVDQVHPAPAWTAAQEEQFVVEIAGRCAVLDILQETN
jgi:hypothetical protein